MRPQALAALLLFAAGAGADARLRPAPMPMPTPTPGPPADPRTRPGVVAPRAEQTTAAAADKDKDKAKPAALSSHRTGKDCFTTSSIDTSSCAIVTDGGRLRTQSCVPTRVPASDCAPGLMCTIDANHQDICMVMQTSLDTGGIIIAVIFAGLFALGLGALTFLCCRESRQQKVLAAKAEAVALARAETKKQRAQEARAPLMRQNSGAPGSPNPFQDGNQA